MSNVKHMFMRLLENWDVFKNCLLHYLKLGICIKLATGYTLANVQMQP